MDDIPIPVATVPLLAVWLVVWTIVRTWILDSSKFVECKYVGEEVESEATTVLLLTWMSIPVCSEFLLDNELLPVGVIWLPIEGPGTVVTLVLPLLLLASWLAPASCKLDNGAIVLVVSHEDRCGEVWEAGPVNIAVSLAST